MKGFGLILLGISTALSLTFCKKKPVNGVETGTVTLELSHFWDDSVFQLNEIFVNPETADTFNFQTFNYYISNIQLKNAAGNWITVPNSYYLINLSDISTTSMTLKNVPKGEYTAISILFGIDSLHNISGAQEGVLSPINGMFWSWNSGYIMLKMEGITPNSTTGSFSFHLAGFEGTNSIVHRKEISFNSEKAVVSNTSPKVSLSINTDQIWKESPSISTIYFVESVGKDSKEMSKAFTNGWEFSHIVN
jgi:hypothetical protein